MTFGHQEHLWRKLQGVHRTGSIPVFHRGKRVAAHPRRYGGPRHGTQPEHMPSAHRRYAEWTPERLQRDARSIGPATEALIIAVLARRPHPEQGFRTCLVAAQPRLRVDVCEAVRRAA